MVGEAEAGRGEGQGLRCKAGSVTGTCFCFYFGSNLLAMRCEKGHDKNSKRDS